MIRAIKSDSGEWVIEICAVPFGSPSDRDSDRQYFSAKTNLHLERYRTQPLIYYHGFTDAKRPAAKPTYVGQTIEGSHQVRDDGVWLKAILDKGVELAQKVWDAALKGLAAASSDSVQHLVRYAADGQILEWPLVAVSVFDTYNNKLPANKRAVVLPAMKMIYDEAGLSLPDDIEPEPEAGAGGESGTDLQGADAAQGGTSSSIKREKEGAMTPEEIQALIDQRMADAQAKADAEAKRKADEQGRIDAAVKAAKINWEAENAASRRLPDGSGGVPYVLQFAETAKYDNLDAGETAFMVGLLMEARSTGLSRSGATESALKALALKAMDDKSAIGHQGMLAMKAANMPLKANELMQATLASYGDEWVGAMYSQQLWEKIRLSTFVADKIRGVEVPQGMESLTIPIEGAGFTFYKVGEAASEGTSGWPNATIASSKAGTGKVTLTPKKLGARALWSGEMEEDSLIPFVPWLRDSLVTDGSEHLESLVLDGDTVLTAATNINNGGTGDTPVTNAFYTTFDGMRKLALVTNSANSRAGAALADTDFINTAKLMGPAGTYALDRSKVSFVIDANLHWLTLTLASLKTRDLNSNPTIENGELTRIYGYDVKSNAHMHKASANRTTNAVGKIDQVTPANNTKSSILAVRWDQWVFGWKRRMKMETTRIPRADATEIVVTMRLDLIPRDNEAAAITYNLS
jgi:HK97 family phage major capsid protein